MALFLTRPSAIYLHTSKCLACGNASRGQRATRLVVLAMACHKGGICHHCEQQWLEGGRSQATIEARISKRIKKLEGTR